MISRELTKQLQKLRKGFPIIAITGPRQSGKSTLAKHIFNLPYVSLEDVDTRMLATEDPRRFFERYGSGCIIDEAQRAPDIFSYLQTQVDGKRTMGRFVLTGSSNFLLMETISQSLAGRVALTTLLPFSVSEVEAADKGLKRAQNYILKGFYPPVYDRKLQPHTWYANYVQTYIERDVRSLQNISDLRTFTQFLHLCAGRVGQTLNYASLAQDCGVAPNTVRQWISILEASYILYLLPPYSQNFGKRIIKMPKMYFYDVGLASFLLGIDSIGTVDKHFAYGALFENFVIMELYKYALNKGSVPRFYYWRDKLGREIDLIVEQGASLKAIEIKAGKTIHSSHFSHLKYWSELSEVDRSNLYLVYNGDTTIKRQVATQCSWKDCLSIVR